MVVADKECEEIDGISSRESRLVLTSVRRSTFLGTSWLFVGRFSVGMLPVTKICRLGSEN